LCRLKGFSSRFSDFNNLIRELDGFKQTLIAEAGRESTPVQSFLSWVKEMVEEKLATVDKSAVCLSGASSLIVLADWMGEDWLLTKYVFPSLTINLTGVRIDSILGARNSFHPSV